MSSGNFQKAFLNNFTIFITLKGNKIILHQNDIPNGYYLVVIGLVYFHVVVFEHVMSLFDLEGTSKYVFGKNIICDVLSSYLTFAFVVIVVVQ